MKKKEEIADELRKKPVTMMFPDVPKKVEQGLCPTCGKPIGEFKDELSRREYEISGMCQECQDSVFPN